MYWNQTEQYKILNKLLKIKLFDYIFEPQYCYSLTYMLQNVSILNVHLHSEIFLKTRLLEFSSARDFFQTTLRYRRKIPMYFFLINKFPSDWKNFL